RFCPGPQVGHRVGQALRVAVEGAPGHQHVGAGGGGGADRVGTDAAVDLDVAVVALDEDRHLGDLLLHGGDVGLAAEARVHGHHQDEVAQVDDVADGVDRGRRVEGHARLGAHALDGG